MSDGADDAAASQRKNVEERGCARQSERDDRKCRLTVMPMSKTAGRMRQGERKTSKEAWWRTLGRGRKRDVEGK